MCPRSTSNRWVGAWPGSHGRRHAGCERQVAGEALLAANVAEGDAERPVLAFDETGAYRLLLSAMAEDPAELQRFYAETVEPLVAYDEQYETGLVTSDQFAAEVNTALESALPAADILEAISAIFQPNLAILAAIDLVKASGVSLGILSNTCEAHWRWILDKQWPMFGPWWSQTVLSYEVQGMKPARKIYEVCEQRAGCHERGAQQRAVRDGRRRGNAAGAVHPARPRSATPIDEPAKRLYRR